MTRSASSSGSERLARSTASASGSKASTLRRVAGDAEREPAVAAAHLEHASPAEVAQPAQRGEVGAFRVEHRGQRGLLIARRFVRLEGGAAGAELLRLAAGVLELGAGVGVDELPGLDPLEAVSFRSSAYAASSSAPAIQ